MTLKVKPKDMGVLALKYWIDEAFKKHFLLDVFSEAAQRSFTWHLAESVRKFYDDEAARTDEIMSPNEIMKYHRENLTWWNDRVAEHPLGMLLGDKFGERVKTIMFSLFSKLNDGELP